MYSITLQNAGGDNVITSGDILGRINFAVPSESDGAASTYIASQIYAQAEGSFTSASNPASLVLATSSADSAPATGRLKVSSDGHLVPLVSGQYDLGSPNYHFRNIYADNIIGDYSGQLDGNLDLNGYDIVGTGNVTIDGNVTAEYFYGDLDGVVVTECRNDTGSTIAEGTPVYVAGYYSSNGKPLIAPADCANAAKMPAIGLLASELTTGSEGHVHVFGLAQNLPSAVTNGFSVGNTVYVDNGGGLTNVRPTGVSELVQNIGRVLKTGTNGRILVLGPGRSNDVPNSGHFEQLTVDGYTALAVDGGNVGIGTASPALAGNDKGLHIHATNYPEIKLTNDTTGSTSDDGSVIQVVNSEFRFTNREDGNNISFYAFDTGGTSRQKLLLSESLILVNGAGVHTDFQVKGENDDNVLCVDANNDNVGIGTNTPLSTSKFQIYNAGSTAKLYSQVISGNNKGVGLLLGQSVIETLDSVNGFYSYTYPSTNGNVTSMYHFRADAPIGSGTVSNQAGFYAGAGLQYGTNNYGFYGNLPSATSNYNIYMGGSAKNYFNGDVGIGTASPAIKLHIKSDTSASYGNLFIEDTTSMAAGVGGSIVFGGAYTTAGETARYGIISAIKENSTSSDSKSAMVFYTNDAVGTFVEERMRITSGGNVGIGTASPETKLDVRSTIQAKAAGVKIQSVDSSVVVKQQAYSVGNIGILGTESNHNLEFRANNIGYMYLTTSGNLGIGKASPSSKLDVAGSGHFDDNISVGLDPLSDHFGLEIYKDKPHIIQRLSDPSGVIIHSNWYGNDEVRFASIAHYGPEYSVGSAFNIGPSGSVFVSYVADIGIGTLSQDSLIFGTYNTERARINPAGWFGIGTDNPSAKLNVENGDVVFNDLGGTYNFRVEGDSDQYLLYVRGSAGVDKVGVGTASLSGKLNASQTTTDDASQPRTLDVRSNDYTTTNGQYYAFGEVSTSKKYVDSGVTDTGYIIGKDILAFLSDEGSLGSAMGIRTYAGLNNESDNGNLTVAYGIQSRVINNSNTSGSINTARGVDVYINGDLREVGNGGIVNAYGVYIGNILNATNSYGVYQAGGTNKNYFAGHVGIGVTNPSSKLNVELGDVAFNSLNGSYTFKVGSTASDNLLYVDGTSNDKVGIGTSGPTAKLDIDSNKLRLRTAKTPSSSSDTGNAGDICWDSNYIYVCVATNTWKRSSLSTW